MPDKSITKVSSANAPTGRFGQKYLASGIRISMRLWEREQPAEAKLQTAHEYETAGFVIEGKAELHIEGQFVLLEKGDFWVVPKGARQVAFPRSCGQIDARRRRPAGRTGGATNRTQ
jgi:quercetin dioxygenase-like cupin family protein